MDLLKDLRASTLVELFEKTNLAEALESSGPYTVFAPTDDAFERLSRTAQRQLEAKPDLLRTMLLTHISPGRIGSRDIADEQRLPTLANGSLAVRIHADRKPTINQVTITVPDAIATNGYVHIVSDVIFPVPARDVIEILDNCPSFSILREYIRRAGLEEQLKYQVNPVTLFAPTDEAFKLVSDQIQEKLFRKDLTGNLTNLAKTILNHVVIGTYYSPSLRDGQQLVTVSEWELEVAVRSNRIREVNIARVIRSDMPAGNGVVHAIDRVLRPDEFC